MTFPQANTWQKAKQSTPSALQGQKNGRDQRKAVGESRGKEGERRRENERGGEIESKRIRQALGSPINLDGVVRGDQRVLLKTLGLPERPPCLSLKRKGHVKILGHTVGTPGAAPWTRS